MVITMIMMRLNHLGMSGTPRLAFLFFWICRARFLRKIMLSKSMVIRETSLTRKMTKVMMVMMRMTYLGVGS